MVINAWRNMGQAAGRRPSFFGILRRCKGGPCFLCQKSPGFAPCHGVFQFRLLIFGIVPAPFEPLSARPARPAIRVAREFCRSPVGARWRPRQRNSGGEHAWNRCRTSRSDHRPALRAESAAPIRFWRDIERLGWAKDCLPRRGKAPQRVRLYHKGVKVSMCLWSGSVQQRA
jgi:hypothetical protein